MTCLSHTLMIIDFSCPVCKAPLAIERQENGGQVNCPKCSKLILLPLDTTLPRRKEDLPPYQPGEQFKVEEITEAIRKSVEPYRRDLENKAELLNDAVEMVKLRNQRIKEIETLMLKTQSELWALEAEMEEAPEPGPEQDSDQEKLEELQGQNQELNQEKEQLDSQLNHMVVHSEQLDQHLKTHWGMVSSISQELELVTEFLSSQTRFMENSEAFEQEASALIGNVKKELDWCVEKIKEAETSRQELRKALETSDQKVSAQAEELAQAKQACEEWRKKAGELEKVLKKQDLQKVENERDEWKQKALDLEAQLAEQGQASRKLTTQLARTEKLQAQQTQDREKSKTFRAEMKENMKLLREQLENERKHHKETIAKLEDRLKSGDAPPPSALEQQLDDARTRLKQVEKKVKDHLSSEKKLHQQEQQIAETLSTLEKQLTEAQLRFESLDMSI